MSRDREVYADIVNLLTATNEFSFVSFGEAINVGPNSSDWLSLVSITHVSDDEIDEYDPIVVKRTCQYRLEIAVREEDPKTRVDALDRLANIARNTLDGVSLGSLTIPGWTKLRRGSLATPKHPEQQITLNGEFVYYIDLFSGHDTAA